MSKKQKLELTWIGKDEQPVLEPRLLIEDPEKSYGDPRSDNMLTIAGEMAPGEHLLVCCKKYSAACTGRHPNIQIKKIPAMLMGRCEFAREDYSLNIVNLTDEDNAPEFVPLGPEIRDQKSEVKNPKVGNKNPTQGELF